ncbi:ATP-binding protein [Streptomyces daghestanicus]|jgi:anti-sigma regulatory factor (Ser/Thr protein kinase)|uniref:ATP-binding protein n=1 Tax=Streptomyces daghestanicus TaxID=66885 RepID=A0ABQ3PXY2_9ACTN|nr:ATP-binding protein [Streptomyces daghestanicus]GHI29895.1 ATP-binding protein [Streptomyces daghestanicus]
MGEVEVEPGGVAGGRTLSGDGAGNGGRGWPESGARRLSVTFEPGTFRVADARHLAVRYLAASLDDRAEPWPDRVVEATQLVVSELVTNAVKYGSGPVRLSLAVADGMLSVTVRDGSATLPAQRPADPGRVGQHGLEIVAALSEELDVRREPFGKRVTARIALR